MSDIAGNRIVAMPAVSMACLEALGESVLGHFQPAALAAPEPVSVVEWIDRLLPPYGVHVMPADAAELGDCVAVTYPVGDFETEILLQEWVWNDLADPQWNFARATAMHELAHAILHVPIIRQLALDPGSAPKVESPGRDAVPAFCDPEWQAWALAGAILMPRRTVMSLPDHSPRSVAAAYRVSESFAAAHLRRLKIGTSEATHTA
jgi:IrrE N-terminal-like domain